MSRNKIEFEKMAEEKDGSKPTCSRKLNIVLERFSERTSMHGCGYIQTSRHFASRLFWVLLTVIAILTLIVHLYMITDQYTDWPKKTTVSLEFNNLHFPAITVCNVNLLKNSAVSKFGSSELQGLIRAVAPETVLMKIQPDNNENNSSEISNSTQLNKRNKRSVSELYDLEWSRFDKDSTSINGFSGGDDDKAPLSILKDTFHYLYMKMSKSDRAAAGHNINDMLLECMFSGKPCSARNFKLYQTASYGNCYTLDSKNMYVQRPGPNGGLYLLLYLQTNEFIQGITNGYGVKVIVHESGTLPLPDDDGVFVAANSETDIALKRTAISRLGSPHGICETGTQFKENFGVNYSVKACHEVCQALHIYKTCSCWYYAHEQISIYINQPFIICNLTKDVLCQKKAMLTLDDKQLNCECNNPCKDAQYSLSISARQWPSQSYAEILREVVCRSSTGGCKEMRDTTKYHELGKNFLLLNIYYETLNFESIFEEPLIDPFTFLSSIGGALGLWIGLSMLSVCEILQLAAEMIECIISRMRHRAKIG